MTKKMTTAQQIEELRRELAAQKTQTADLRSALSRVFRELGKLTPNVIEARRLCMDTSPIPAWKAEAVERRPRGQSVMVSRHIFYTRGAAEDYAESCEDGQDHTAFYVSKALPGDKEFA